VSQVVHEFMLGEVWGQTNATEPFVCGSVRRLEELYVHV